MTQSKKSLLIIEDDETLSKGLYEAFRRKGLAVFLAASPSDALKIVSDRPIDWLIVDCLLPQMSGLDVVEKIREKLGDNKFKVVLMSGIYTDKSYIQEATKKSRAVAFIKKPFEIEDCIKIINLEEDDPSAKSSSHLMDSDSSVLTHLSQDTARKKLYNFFSKSNVTNREKRKVLESLGEISGFDLPFVYSLLSETKSSGYLNIYWPNKTVSGVSFSGGSIVEVDTEDETTLLGEMIIQSGYAVTEDIKSTLRNHSSNKRLGERLVQSNQLSPHAFDLILQEQMNIRLSRTIENKTLRMNFSSADVDPLTPSIDSDSLLEFLNDWIASKISVAWLRNIYVLWSSHIIIRAPSYNELSPALKMPLVKNLDGLLQRIEKGVTINQLLEEKSYTQGGVYKAIHFLLTKGMIVFANRVKFTNESEQLSFLRKLYDDIQDRSPQEVAQFLELGAVDSSKESLLTEILTCIGEKPSQPHSEIYKLWNAIKQIAEGSLLENPSSEPYQSRSGKEKDEVAQKIKAQALLEQVKHELQLNQFSKALQKIHEISHLTTEISGFYIYSAWAKLGLYNPNTHSVSLKEIDFDIMQIPPDEKYEATYPFVLGLFKKANGDLLGARKSLERALALDSTLIVARRELSILDNQLRKKNDVFNLDLKDVVTNLFKRK